MSVQKTKYITPLYDTILDKTIGNVLMSFFEGDAGRAWDSLLTLYDVLDSEIKSEVKGLIDEVQMHINKQMARRGYAQSDVLKKQRILQTYVNEKKHELFEKIIMLLLNKGYLKKAPRDIPTNVPPDFFEPQPPSAQQP